MGDTEARLARLVAAIRERRVILFVGAGVSANLGLASWKTLIAHMAEELGQDPDEFANLGTAWTLAEYYKLNKKAIGPLRSWMDVNWHGSGIDIARSPIHKRIVELDFPLIYTTNYDKWLERAFEHYKKPYVRILTVNDMQSVREGVTQIVKFHGDFDDDESIVFTESDFFRRLDFESPLDIRFRADALGKSILFIGYSLNDIDMRLMLYKLWQAWERAGFGSERPPSYVFLPRPNPVQETVMASWGVTTLTEDGADPAESLGRFLDKLAEGAGRS
jgi:hypothetical protein